MDLNIVREVKGSMPDVVYPHKQHTEWLDCSNYPAIFKPQKGANQISMAGILLGQQCGVCHGKVAFPVSECRLCHSKPKSPATPRPCPPPHRRATRPRAERHGRTRGNHMTQAKPYWTQAALALALLHLAGTAPAQPANRRPGRRRW